MVVLFVLSASLVERLLVRVPPKSKQQPLEIGEAIRSLAEGMLVQAKNPSVLNYKPHAKQYAFHSSDARMRLYIGGNRSGKTVGGVVEDCLWLMGKHPWRRTPLLPVRGRVVGVDFINGIDKNIIPQISQWLPTSELKGGSWDSAYNKELRTLTLENGSFIEFMSYDQDLDKFSGTSRHFVHFDEEPPKDIFTECFLRTVDVGGSMWITMTPVEGMTWIYDDIYEPGLIHQRESTEVITVDMTENPYLSQGEIQALVNSLDAEDREARVHGKFVRLGGLIYKDFSVDTHVIPRGSLDIPKDGIIIASLDAGYNNPTAWLWHYVDPDGNPTTFKEHYASGMVVEEHAQRVHEINKEIGRAPDYYVGDPSIQNTSANGTSIQQDYIKYGIPILLGNNAVRDGINRVAGYLRVRPDVGPRWHVTANCTALISEMLKYRWKTYANRRLINQNNLQEEPHKKNDHACDSLRYFIMSQPDIASGYIGRTTKTSSPNDWVGAPSAIDPLMPQLHEPRSPSDFNSEYNSTGTFTVDSDGSDDFGSEW
jgi:phage terminase large subunit-like protein